jgi:magnesium transporter
METDIKILDSFINNHTDESILIIEGLSVVEIIELLKSLPVESAALLLGKMDRIKAAFCIEKAERTLVEKLLETCAPSISANILRLVDQNLVKALLGDISTEHSNAIKQIIKYPVYSVGAYLDPMVFTLKQNLNIGQALELIKGNDKYVQSHIFVLSPEQILVGQVELKALITGNPSKPIRSIMKTNLRKIVANINVKALIDGKIEYEELPIMPIVDIHDVFLGVVDKKSLAAIKVDKESKGREEQQASIALGDLYQIGLSSLLRSTSELLWNVKNK